MYLPFTLIKNVPPYPHTHTHTHKCTTYLLNVTHKPVLPLTPYSCGKKKKNNAKTIYLEFCLSSYLLWGQFLLQGQGLDHVGTLGNFVVPHWKESLPLCTL